MSPVAEDTVITIDKFGEERLDALHAAVGPNLPGARRFGAIVIDKSPLFRAGLLYSLHGSKFDILAQYSSVEDFVSGQPHDERCVALIGIDRGVCRDLASLAALRGKACLERIVFLADRLDVDDLAAAIELGCDGYVLKSEITPQILVSSLELVTLGGKVLSQECMKVLVQPRPNRAESQPTAERAADADGPAVVAAVEPGAEQVQTEGKLSNRETAILLRLMDGASNKHIARELNIAEATVKVHVKSVLRKIRVRNRTQAATWALTRCSRAATAPHADASSA